MENNREGTPGTFDAVRCIRMLEEVRDYCDGASKTRVAIRISEAIELLENECPLKE